ncbi:SDR family NAD(P)-dependent oxidoreductase [Aeromicrobium duanguangcaii]|uniref:SDR family NAD(P)-dependent oxidoreductase n=1 Tax=Aeromicrobium duanguangcaii TaxID=2968086 RepID=UPI002017676F|nr:SDR family NAD(P)-dependent oxidoreductase [Aeromicrobium duanguangcaii]MCL3838524.1 SDR family NAD(P)-dependent oxidoreductase [Aeromicrobium duanguangcaii]
MGIDPAGQVIVVTGSSSGIGAAAARRLAARGARVCLLARRADELESLAAAIRTEGRAAEAYPVDLTDDDSTAAAVEHVLGDHGRIDVLVNNAARSIRRPIVESFDRLHDHERVMAINYFASVRLIHLVLPSMLAQGRGHVVVSSTLSTQVPIPLFSAYLASKSALESYIRSLSAELGHAGITTSTVHFPMVRTQMSGGTEIYRAMKMMTPDEAARWIERAVVSRPSRVTSAFGVAGETSMALAPGIVTRATAPFFRRMDRSLARRTAVGDVPE